MDIQRYVEGELRNYITTRIVFRETKTRLSKVSACLGARCFNFKLSAKTDGFHNESQNEEKATVMSLFSIIRTRIEIRHIYIKKSNHLEINDIEYHVLRDCRR